MNLLFETGKVDVNEEKLRAFDEYCQNEGSDEFIIIKDGRLFYKNYSNTKDPIQLNSLTKVFAGTAIGLLLDEGYIDTLHTPIGSIFPSLNDDPKKDITIWHILTHTSGIKTLGHDIELSNADNCVEYALSMELENIPGKVSKYNNEAVALISGIVEKLSGESLDEYLSRRIFKPLGITNWSWLRDKSQNPYPYAGLALTGIDLAKFAHLYLNNGLWKEQRILSEKWIQDSTKPTQNIDRKWGYLWLTAHDKSSKYIGYGMSGYEGKYLFVSPANNFIAIRLVHRKKGKQTPNAEKFFHYAIDLMS
ncbi:beta-lactamase family protein [Sporosarcina sp. ACRSL]|uniref:serine hydrolase domain-containing protein n=1 Tax=Sporosarcina sp. ACRSL TaxID=2918215 RepID=UPI001EF64AF1|nr:serine hydrolase [Sporosarcina sp. ACRSL]MCG7344462.1 beta-lactamase family protein [Sporosarcina sp. ACRSL]